MAELKSSCSFSTSSSEQGFGGKLPHAESALTSFVLGSLMRGSDSGSNSGLGLAQAARLVLCPRRDSQANTLQRRAPWQVRSLAPRGHLIGHLNLQIHVDTCHRDPKTAIIKFDRLKCLKRQSGSGLRGKISPHSAMVKEPVSQSRQRTRTQLDQVLTSLRTEGTQSSPCREPHVSRAGQ